jgi:ubiquinone/menaquinone biosynthesis C-methylase UbiE
MNENEFYRNIYTPMQSGGLHRWFIVRTHKMLEKKLKSVSTKKIASILEVGGNIGEHIEYVRAPFSKYLLTDYRDTNFVSDDPRISFQVVDVQDIPYPENIFDRVICTCLLHHVENVSTALTEMLRVTKLDGTISILLPCDPGVLYRFAKWIGPNRAWKKRGILNPNFFHYSQHKNHFPSIKSAIKEIYKNEEVFWYFWPFRIKSWNLNMFAVITIRKAEK